MVESIIIFLGLRVLGGMDVYHSNNLSDLAVTRQILKEIQNQNHTIRYYISSLSERDMRTTHPHSMDDFKSPKMWGKNEDITGESQV